MPYDMDTEDEEGIRVVIAEGDPLARRTVREALRQVGINVVAEAPTASEAVDLTTFYRPDVVLIDDRAPVLDGVELARTIHERSPDVRIIVLSGEPDDERGLMALRAGASGYMSREFDPSTLPRVVQAAVEGEAAISRRLAMTLVESYRRAPRGGAGLRPVRSPLTDREWEVLDLLASGAGTEEIARTLVLSTETVRSHLKNLFRKLGVGSRREAVEAARKLRDPVG